MYAGDRRKQTLVALGFAYLPLIIVPLILQSLKARLVNLIYLLLHRYKKRHEYSGEQVIDQRRSDPAVGLWKGRLMIVSEQ